MMGNDLHIYFVRHGTTSFTGPPDRFCGRSDPHLTAEGHSEMSLFGLGIADQVSVSRIYTSDMKRTVESAEILSEALHAPVIQHRDLREVDFGAWEGLTKEQAQNRDPVLFARWESAPHMIVPPGGTSATEAADRASCFVKGLRTENATALVVSHKTFLRIALCAWLNIDLARHRSAFDIYPATLGAVHFSRTFAQLVLLNWTPAGWYGNTVHEDPHG